jgi:PAS domain-containing protein
LKDDRDAEVAARAEIDPALAALPEPLAIARDFIDVLPIPVFFKGRDGGYIGVNKAWEDFFGVQRKAIVGASVVDLYPQDPSIAQRHMAMDEEL